MLVAQSGWCAQPHTKACMQTVFHLPLWPCNRCGKIKGYGNVAEIAGQFPRSPLPPLLDKQIAQYCICTKADQYVSILIFKNWVEHIVNSFQHLPHWSQRCIETEVRRRKHCRCSYKSHFTWDATWKQSGVKENLTLPTLRCILQFYYSKCERVRTNVMSNWPLKSRQLK